ncbi:hypothetical protein [Pleomorphomonas carboxyditropha]|uniref:hypothetical protein n=1 Tax=Pleomorphomonas carboxyditropha TaxID=2023338 RepID=UPI0013FE02EF|nr:hypothetical protein [Pleomorphomonas carboxyditropha]
MSFTGDAMAASQQPATAKILLDESEQRCDAIGHAFTGNRTIDAKRAIYGRHGQARR